MATVKEKYRTLVDLAPDPIFLVDIQDRTVVEINESAESLLGYDHNSLVGMDVTELHPADQRDQYRALFEQTIEQGEMRTTHLEDQTQLYLVTRDGTKVPVEIHASKVPIDDGVWVLGIARDITERNERNTKLNRQNQRLEQFTSVVSHDLRNPLNVAQLHLDMARREHDSEHLATVENSLQRMETLIDDLLSLAKKGKTVDEMEPIDIGMLAQQCWENVDTEGATIRTASEYKIQGDSSRVEQLLENLIRNAIEHTNETVSITVGTLADSPGFYVEDDGQGIDEDNANEVFDAGFTTTADGTGFGLNIVEQIAEAHGWSIRIINGAEGGARFEITGTEKVES
jgi:PAS domain S-box-containing protein